jgi:hypothetical protein
MKKILMAAAAVTALTAGSANAASIYAAKVSNIDAVASSISGSTTTTTYTPYKIASETKYGTSGLATTTTSGHNATSLRVDQGRLTNAGTNKDYTVTFTYAGPAGFSSALTSSSLSLNATAGSYSGCTSTITLGDGGLAKGKTVTYVVNLASGCTASAGPDLFVLDAPLTVTGTGEVTVSGKVSTGGTSIDNGDATARTLIKNDSGISFTTDIDTDPTQWLLAGTTPYTTLSSNNKLGKYTLSLTTTNAQGPFVTADGTNTAKVDAQDLKADVSVSGDVSVTTISVGGTAATKNTAKDTSTRSAVGQSGTAVDITIAADSGITASQPSRSYSMTVTPTTSGTTLTVPAAKTQTLQTVGLEGTNFNVPWVAGNQSPSSTVVRIANNGTTASGAVTVMMKSPVRNTGTTAGATTCTSTALPALAKIGAGEELILGTTELTTCFGDFKRGDIIVTIQGAKTNLTAKARLTTASGQISETSIGGLEQFGAY